MNQSLENQSNSQSLDMRPRALVIDDQSANILLVNNILKDEYTVFMATSARDGLEVARLEQPDIILLDVMMPETDGFEACRWLKEDLATMDIPVMFVTGCDSIEEEEKGLNVGAVDFISKPLNPTILRARMRTHLNRKRQADQLRDLAQFDPLTGVANQHRFDTQLRAEWTHCTQTNVGIALVLVECTNATQLSNQSGRATTDLVLQCIARTLCASLRRPRDFVARLEGNRFACVLPDSDESTTSLATEQIERAMATLAQEQNALIQGSSWQFLLSAAHAKPDAHGTSPEALLTLAEQRLL